MTSSRQICAVQGDRACEREGPNWSAFRKARRCPTDRSVSESSCRVGMHVRLRQHRADDWPTPEAWRDRFMRLLAFRERSSYAWKVENTDASCVASHAGSLSQSFAPGLEELGRPRHQGLRPLARLQEFPRRHGGDATRHVDRSHRQQRELRAWQLSLGNRETASSEQQEDEAFGTGRTRDSRSTRLRRAALVNRSAVRHHRESGRQHHAPPILVGHRLAGALTPRKAVA